MGKYQEQQLAKLAEARKKNIKNIAIMAVIVLVGFLAFQALRPEHRDIRTVRSIIHQPSRMTYEAILEGYTNRGSWSRHASAQFMRVVEFSGVAPNGDRILIQFSDIYGLHNNEWIIANMEINGRQMGSIETHAWLTYAANAVRRR